jgi:hypothetical protein
VLRLGVDHIAAGCLSHCDEIFGSNSNVADYNKPFRVWHCCWVNRSKSVKRSQCLWNIKNSWFSSTALCWAIKWPLTHQKLLIYKYSIVLNDRRTFETSRTVDSAVQHCVEQLYGLWHIKKCWSISTASCWVIVEPLKHQEELMQQYSIVFQTNWTFVPQIINWNCPVYLISNLVSDDVIQRFSTTNTKAPFWHHSLSVEAGPNPHHPPASDIC